VSLFFFRRRFNKEVVAAAGGDPTKAFQLLLIEKLQVG
jgi:hypothetical protein